MQKLHERIKQLRGKESLRSFASRLGISYSTLRFYEEGRIPSANFILALSNATQISIDWILRGSGAESNGSHPSGKTGRHTNHGGLFSSECAQAPPHFHGNQPPDYHPPSQTKAGSFSPPGKGESQYIHLTLMTDSMASILPKGTTVVVDTNQQNPEKLNGKIVALKIEKKLAVRYLYLDKLYYKLYCENHLYCPLFITRNRQDVIIGQVTNFYGKI